MSETPATAGGPVLPILRPADWEGAEHAIAHHLIALVDAPWVAFAWSIDPLLAYVGPERLQVLGKTADQIVMEALANLEALAQDWQMMDLGRGEPLPVAMLQYPSAAEQILNRRLMRRLQAAFEPPGLLAVAVPFRGLLLGTSIANALDGSLGTLARNLFSEPRGEPITDMVFALDDGEITSRVTQVADLSWGPTEPPET
jgi:hypothetical protein